MSFKLWSELNNDALKSLKPDFGYRSWNELSKEDKETIWRHLESHFFTLEIQQRNNYFSGATERFYDFPGTYPELKKEIVAQSVQRIVQLYKARNFAKEFFEKKTYIAACEDFLKIFIYEDEDVVFELLSLYCKVLLMLQGDEFYGSKSEYKSVKEYEKAKDTWVCEIFDGFAKDLNEVFGDFGINIYLTRNGFIPKQDEKIINEIYEPVINFLSDLKWKKVNELLSDAFAKFRENTSHGFSTCVTHTVAAVEAFLQIIVKGKTGEGDFAALISEGQRKNLIPNDMFTKDVFKIVVSVLMRERKETGDAHVKESYATEKNAKMVLNLAMIFMQHCVLS